MPKRLQVTLTNDIAYVLGVTATNDGVTESVIMQKALEHYLSGRLRYPPIARAARALGSKMPDRVLNGAVPAPSSQHGPPPASRRSPNDRGSLTVFFVIVALALFLVVGLSIDGGRMLATRGQVTFDAAAASRAGASASPGNAVGAAEQVLSTNGAGLSPTPSPDPSNSNGQFCVTAQQSEPTLFLGLVGISKYTARQTECATTQAH